MSSAVHREGQLMVDTDFWLRYLRAHADPRTRRIHVAGTTLATALIGAALATRCWRLAGLALACGYGPAWFAHAFVERNRPETFAAPLRSLAADYRMWWGTLGGTLERDLAAALGAESRSGP
jgi:hypothetical protein